MLSSPIFWITLLVALLVAGLLLWHFVFKYRLLPKRWGVVEEGMIYRSGQLHRALVHRVLRDNGIDVIVNMNRKHLHKPDHAAEIAAADALGIEKHWFTMNGDGTGDPENYALAVHQLSTSRQAGKTVLVHCTAGAQRTGAVVALYRTLLLGWSAEQAVAEMSRYRFDPEGDIVLLEFIDEHLPAIATQLQTLGTLEEVPDPLPRFVR